ncbi:MAG TPA: HAMP domain-containing protein [Pelagibacteraceae bacterium]|nr:HAMP domain-containing protein [Pelagibacteraceae bacterium]
MIHTIKNYKWVIATFLICIVFGLLTFFTFINQGFIKLNDFNLQILLVADLILLILFFTLIIYKIYKILSERRKGKLGSETSLRYILFFSTTTLLPSIIIAIFSLILFNVGLQKYFDSKIKTVVSNSAEVAKNYVDQIRSSIEADISLMVLDVNNQSALYYEKPKQFLNVLSSQRLLRRLDEVHLLDSSGNIIMSNIVDISMNFVPPPEEAFIMSLDGRPVRIVDPRTNRTSALVKLNNFIDTYLYIVKFMDPKVINYLKQTGEAVSFYYSVQERKTGIKITFAVIYLLIVSLLLFLSIILSINFASRLTTPIINLITASEKISSGDLNAKVAQIETDKDFKKLNLNFNSMIEKLRKQQDKLLLSERHAAWESVARKLAHEIKNPLTPIQLSIDRIKEKYLNKIDGDKDFSNYLNTITKQIKDIEYLLNEFSDFARMPKPILKKVDLNKIISRSVNLHEMSNTDKTFRLSKGKLSSDVSGDEEQLNRVFINLIKNSIESIDEKKSKKADFKGEISIDIKADSDYIYVTIIDNGVGFEQVDKTKMLTPYYTTKKKGTGLGLAIVTKVISDHNGTILFNSIKNGAKVDIVLPKYYG